MESASENMQSVRDELRDRIEIVHREREVQLVAREKNIEGLYVRIILFKINFDKQKKCNCIVHAIS